MILIRVRLFWLFALLIVLGFLLLGIFAWYSLQQAETMADYASIPELKFASERILFFSIILGGGSLILVSILFVLSRNNTRRAENLLLSKRWMQDDSGTELWESRFGDLGRGFYKVNRDLLETNRRRGTKIKSMNSLVNFLVKNYDEAMLVVNAAGEIVYISNEYLEKTKINRSEIYRSPINDVLNDVYFSELVSEFGKKPGMQEISSNGLKYSVYNIADSRGESVYLLFFIGAKNYQNVMDMLSDMNSAKKNSGKKKKNRRWLW